MVLINTGFNSTIYSVADVAANLTASIANFSSILISMSSFDANKTMDLFPVRAISRPTHG